MSCSTRGYLIHRAATSSCPAAEGWVPSYVIQPPAPSPVSPQPPSHLSFSSSDSKSSLSNSPSNPTHSSGFPAGSPTPGSVGPHPLYSKKSWIKFRKPSFSKREAKAAASRRDDNDKTKAGSDEKNFGGGDRSSAGSGSFGDMYSVSNSSDISISDRLSDRLSFASDFQFIKNVDDTSDCVIVGDGGDDLLKLTVPLSHLTISPGQPFTLSLTVSGSGSDTASVSWFGPSGELDHDTRYEQQHLRNGTIALHLDSCTHNDAGRYTCVVTCVGKAATRQLRCSANITFN